MFARNRPVVGLFQYFYRVEPVLYRNLRFGSHHDRHGRIEVMQPRSPSRLRSKFWLKFIN